MICKPCSWDKELEERVVSGLMSKLQMTEMDAREFWAKVSGLRDASNGSGTPQAPQTLMEAQKGLCGRHKEVLARHVTDLIRLGFLEREAVKISMDTLNSLRR